MIFALAAGFGIMSSTDSEGPDCSVCDDIHQQGLKSQPPKLSYKGKIVLAVGASVAAVIYGIAIPFVLPGFRRICLPFVPATDQQINNVLKCLRGRSGSVVDLGSGDGRIILSVMKNNLVGNYDMAFTKADGVELNMWLVAYSNFQKWRQRQLIAKKTVKFFKKDIFKTNLRIYDNVIIFGVESLMMDLEGKLGTELKKDGLVAACRFPFPNCEPISMEGDGIDKVWVYNSQSFHKFQSTNV